MLEHYAEQAPFIGDDKERDRSAQIVAVERAGYTRASTDRAKLRQFMKLWKSDESRAYLCHLWGIHVEADHDPVALAMRMVHEHMVQKDEKWGPPDRAVSLAATREAIKLFIPVQTTKILSGHLSAKIERPAQFDQEPVMESRSILPAGQKIAKPVAQSGGDENEEEDEDDND